MIRVYDEAGNVIEAHEHKGNFKKAEVLFFRRVRRFYTHSTDARNSV